MKVRNTLLMILVVVLIFACSYVVINGVSFGAKDFLPLKAINRGLDLTGGVYVVYEAENPDVEDLDSKMTGAMEIFRSRLDDKGFTEATITRQGDTRIRVEVPINETSEIQDPTQIVDFIGKPAHLEFQYPDGTTIVTGEDITEAKAMLTDEGKYVVSIKMSSEGAEAFSEATQKLYKETTNNYIVITLDGATISQATVQAIITNGQGQIEGSFTQESASELAMQIESGALPLDLNPIEQRSISATLGDEALQKSIFAGIVGLCVLMLFMIAVYRVPGLMADIALVAYITIVLFIVALFQIQLTLPGIAGIILGIGMAVDANVVIFARFKEECYTGKTPRTALKAGYSKAARAITDSNVTTLIAAVVLGIYGTGPIKGFAYTLGISIVVSLFSALVVTRVLMKLMLGIAPNGKKMYLPAKKSKGGEEA